MFKPVTSIALTAATIALTLGTLAETARSQYAAGSPEHKTFCTQAANAATARFRRNQPQGAHNAARNAELARKFWNATYAYCMNQK